MLLTMGLRSCKDRSSQTNNEPFIDFAGMDSTVKAGEDFFSYANGKWYQNTVIPADQSGWSTAHILYEDNREKLHAMLEESAAGNNFAKGSPEQMMGDLYAGAMDSSAIDKAGYTPIVNDLRRIDGLSSASDIVRECAYEYSQGGGNLLRA